MKIIIAGAGEVGSYIAHMLATEAQDTYLIDNNKKRLDKAQQHNDIIGLEGDAKDVAVLIEAGVKSCDLLIAATSSEETNLLICILGKKLGAKRTISRISNFEEIGSNMRTLYKEIGVDHVISPVEIAAKEIHQLIEHEAFLDNYDFEGGKLSVFSIQLAECSPLVGNCVLDSKQFHNNLSFKPVSILRHGETVMVQARTEFLTDDIVYFISTPKGYEEIPLICGQEDFDIKDVMILGASKIGVLTAERLEGKYNVTLIEQNEEKANKIALKLKKTLVIHGDGTDVSLLEEQSIEDMDAFIAVTGDSETNIISSLVAKSHGVRKTISGVENIDYIKLSHNIGIDTLINKKVIAANDILKYIRKGEVNAIATLNLDAEVIEFTVKANSKITHKILKELNLPPMVNIAGVVRDGKGFVPFGEFQMAEGDKAIVFTNDDAIHKIEKFFQ
ncbi:Trk system potassium transporter TrkA [Flavobacteriales bacterium]|jgi:trk system potassium uptake protein TrkA|nr:Trk system potassium transporter TrkA [Flavobacteriales bacterium]MDG1349152.1 Trk system potassium transporter TrkA [Flavobacteriales bacterium]